MITVPDGWVEAASGSHAPKWRARILDPAGALVVGDLPVVGGQITRDESSTPRTTVNVDVPTTAAPALIDQAYLPVGNRLQVQWSVAPSTTWVTVADVDMVASAISRPEDMWTLAGADRAARIALDDLGRGDIPTFGGDTYANTIAGIVHRTFPGTPVDATGPATTQIVPAKYGGETQKGDPWQLAVYLAAEAQSEVFYDTARRVVIREIPGVGTPVDTLGVGAGGQLTGYTLNHEMGINAVQILYLNQITGNLMIRGFWEDTRPNSPISVQRIGSRVSHVVEVRSDDAPTRAEADAAAAAMARRYAGRARQSEVRHPARPWLEPGDTVAVTYLGGPTEPQVVKSVGIDLGPDNIQVTRLRNADYQMGVPV